MKSILVTILLFLSLNAFAQTQTDEFIQVCTSNINQYGNPSGCSCPTVREVYNSVTGSCEIKAEVEFVLLGFVSEDSRIIALIDDDNKLILEVDNQILDSSVPYFISDESAGDRIATIGLSNGRSIELSNTMLGKHTVVFVDNQGTRFKLNPWVFYSKK